MYASVLAHRYPEIDDWIILQLPTTEGASILRIQQIALLGTSQSRLAVRLLGYGKEYSLIAYLQTCGNAYAAAALRVTPYPRLNLLFWFRSMGKVSEVLLTRMRNIAKREWNIALKKYANLRRRIGRQSYKRGPSIANSDIVVFDNSITGVDSSNQDNGECGFEDSPSCSLYLLTILHTQPGSYCERTVKTSSIVG